ncbi:thioredoxin domain-containing protein [Pseudoalteromonas sp. MMG022]|uniref:DsbA family protein n=1 Tax=Pseudoalteromonas sp. MMG022 TaxID=2909978 RepID=UPI001F1F4963|nr:thioredoxin domain-containing protein [Pseudoalteromonas sp. MMG022]MCF6434942.1 DsbA family protein [Pseudoalteromonas sp. MMG022]
MKNWILPIALSSVLAGCNTTQQAELDELRAEVEQLKSVQQQVAVRVGLAELVKPETLPLSQEGKWIGDKSNDVVVIEYTDLHCPFCKKFQQEIWPEFKKQYVDTGEAAVLARELPLSKLHPKAGYAAVFLRCTNQQGQYEQVKDKLFEIGNSITQETTAEVAQEFNLDEQKLTTCLADTSVHEAVGRSISDAQLLGIGGTPSFVVGRQKDGMLVDYQVIVGGSLEKLGAAIKALK